MSTDARAVLDRREGEPRENAGFFIPGPIVPQPRMTRRSRYGTDRHGKPTAKARAVDRYLQYKQDIGWAAKASGVRPVEGFVHLTLELYVKDRRKRRWDLSNAVKAIEDGLNQIAYVDDKQVVGVDARIYTAAHYDGQLGVHVWVTEVS